MIACAYTGSMFWLTIAVAALCIMTALYEQGRHTNEERTLRETLRVTKRDLEYANVELDFMRSDPEGWETR